MAKSKNAIRRAPWLAGIIDTLVGAKLIKQSSIPHRNRLAVILLDSAFETASRAYLQYIGNVKLQDSHRHRENLVKAMKGKLYDIDEQVWRSLDFYYNEIRCDFYHQSSSKTITDESLTDYQETVEFIIDRALGIHSAQQADLMYDQLTTTVAEKSMEGSRRPLIPLTQLRGRNLKTLVAVATVMPSSYQEVNEFFKREGEVFRLTSHEFTNIVSRNSGSKRLFYYGKELKKWELSAMGRFKLKQLQQEYGNDESL